MTIKIFRSIIAVALIVLLASLIIIGGVLYQYFSDIQETQLKEELMLLAAGTEELGIDYLKNLEKNKYRVTWISESGNVIYDNQVKKENLDNHLNREEIKEALLAGSGHSSRKSKTLDTHIIYESTKLKDGSVLRISTTRSSILFLILQMAQPISIIILIAIILSLLLARRMSKKIVEPLNSLDLEKPSENDAYEELSPLLNHIKSQQNKIKYQLEELRRKEEEFDQITKNMKESLVLLDDKEKIISINPAAMKLFDTNSKCIGEDLLTIERKRNLQEAILKAKENGHSSFIDERNKRKYQFDLTKITSDKNYGMVILAFDITDELDREKMRREFSANVSHELKTPLQSIIGSAELLKNKLVKPDDVPKFIEKIYKESNYLVELINDIIFISKLDENTEIKKENVSLKTLSYKVVETLSDFADEKNIKITVEGDDGILFGSRHLLHEMIYNLCDNAIKYNKINGLVKILITDESDKIKFSIQDTGIGIPKEEQNKIFERFYRVDKSHSKKSGGTGLGLSIVKHAYLYHEGKIHLESEINKGSKITISFTKKRPS